MSGRCSRWRRCASAEGRGLVATPLSGLSKSPSIVSGEGGEHGSIFMPRAD